MDTYCKINLGGETFQTRTANDQGKTPQWKDALEFRLSGEQTFKVSLWDKDIGGKDDFLGEAVIPILPEMLGKRGYTDWYNLVKKGKSGGKIQLMYEFYSANQQGYGFTNNHGVAETEKPIIPYIKPPPGQAIPGLRSQEEVANSFLQSQLALQNRQQYLFQQQLPLEYSQILPQQQLQNSVPMVTTTTTTQTVTTVPVQITTSYRPLIPSLPPAPSLIYK